MSESFAKPRSVLFVTYAFPPVSYVGGFRTLRFVRHMADCEWQSQVLTPAPSRFTPNDEGMLAQIPNSVRIHRTRFVNPITFLNQIAESLRGMPGPLARITRLAAIICLRGLSWLTIPDHAVFWIPVAVLRGLVICRRDRPAVIVTSSPPASIHLVGILLQAFTGIPWIADFRDPILDAPLYRKTGFRRWI